MCSNRNVNKGALALDKPEEPISISEQSKPLPNIWAIENDGEGNVRAVFTRPDGSQIFKQRNSEKNSKCNLRTDNQSKRELSSCELVRACSKSSEHPAWTEFYGRFDRYIKMYVSKALRNRNLAHSKSISFTEELKRELTQEVYLQLLRDDQKALHNFRGKSDSSFLAYLSMITVNVVAEHFRKQHSDKRNGQLVSVEQLSNEESGSRKIMLQHLSCNPEADYLSGIAVNELSELLDKILIGSNSKRDKLIFMLHYIDGMTAQEISSIRGVGVKAISVDSIIRRTRNRLQQVLTRIAA